MPTDNHTGMWGREVTSNGLSKQCLAFLRVCDWLPLVQGCVLIWSKHCQNLIGTDSHLVGVMLRHSNYVLRLDSSQHTDIPSEGPDIVSTGNVQAARAFVGAVWINQRFIHTDFNAYPLRNTSGMAIHQTHARIGIHGFLPENLIDDDGAVICQR